MSAMTVRGRALLFLGAVATLLVLAVLSLEREALNGLAVRPDSSPDLALSTAGLEREAAGQSAAASSRSPCAVLAAHGIPHGPSAEELARGPRAPAGVTVVDVHGHGPAHKVYSMNGLYPRADGDEALKETLTRLAKHCVDDSHVVVDVGGFLGDFGIMAAALGCRAYIFEPQPSMYRIIKEAILLNTFAGRVTVVNAAVSSGGPAKLDMEDSMDGRAHLHDFARDEVRPESFALVQVDVVALDDVFLSDTIAVLKVDTEGHDPSVLRSAARIRSERRLKHLMTEYSPFMLGLNDWPTVVPEIRQSHEACPARLFCCNRGAAAVYGPFPAVEDDLVWRSHLERHLQTDILAVYDCRPDLGDLPISGPWTQHVMA